ncbi:polysaccharide biosynthesis/export family protein [Pseudooceanicola sp. HF7]|uniref:polysaccharide biosynthesis/export family protein n=1 Tax=Pseudooceanicola sp. HF7 TaxID=2721560 RepID=UPI00158A510D|nr:polysaccharide biosynthesis/export family protein [Pseudooceanicola sp. HF7]
MRALFSILFAVFTLTGCGVIYHSPSVNSVSRGDSKVRVIPMTAQNIMVANRASYHPKTLPAIFSQTAGTGRGMRGVGAGPEPALDQLTRPVGLETRIPPAVQPGPYRIGVGDVVLLATPQTGNTVEQLSGLLAAQNSRQGYTVQDDGAIAIPNVGRVNVSGMTLEEAEATLFQRLVENQIDPTFSLEIAEFHSKRVSVGGAVANPTVVPVTLTPRYLDEVLTAAGGVTTTDLDYASIRIYRDGTLYQIPLTELYSNASLQRIQLVDGDSVFVDTTYDLDLAQAYFTEQIRLAEYRQDARVSALNELTAEVNLRRANLDEARENYMTRLDLDSVDRDYVYLSGEVKTQSRYALPFDKVASLADALYDNGAGVPTRTGDVSQIYVLRGSDDPREFSAITAWRLDARNATNLIMATRFELRPNDIIFVAEQPVTKWNRVVDQIVPSLLTTSAASVIE